MIIVPMTVISLIVATVFLLVRTRQPEGVTDEKTSNNAATEPTGRNVAANAPKRKSWEPVNYDSQLSPPDVVELNPQGPDRPSMPVNPPFEIAREVRVGPESNADYPTLAEAVEAANAAGQSWHIHLAAGRYTDGCELLQNTVIEGDGPLDEVVIVPSPPLLIGRTPVSVILKGVTIVAPGADAKAAPPVAIRDGDLLISECRISGPSAVRIVGGAVKAERSWFRETSVLAAAGDLDLRDCEFLQCTMGVMCQGAKSLNISGCRFRNGGLGIGVRQDTNTQAVTTVNLTTCSFAEMEGGLEIIGPNPTTVSICEFKEIKSHGMSTTDALLTLQRVRFHKVGGRIVDIGGGTLDMTDCLCKYCDEPAVLDHVDARLTNTWFQSGHDLGLIVSFGTQLTATNCRFAGNANEGLAVVGDGTSARCTGCEFDSNRGNGVVTESPATLQLTDCRLRGNTGFGACATPSGWSGNEFAENSKGKVGPPAKRAN